MLYVSPNELAEALGDDEVTLLHRMAAEMATGHVVGYTRGRGLVNGKAPADMRAVTLAAALRLVTNLGQWQSITETVTGGGESDGATLALAGGGWRGFTLTELLVLRRYRRTTS